MRRVLRWRDTGYYWQHPGDGPSSQLALGATPSILQPPPAASVTNTLAALQQLLTLHAPMGECSTREEECAFEYLNFIYFYGKFEVSAH